MILTVMVTLKSLLQKLELFERRIYRRRENKNSRHESCKFYKKISAIKDERVL